MKNRSQLAIVVVVALATFFTSSYSVSKSNKKGNHNKKFQSDPPSKQDSGAAVVPPSSAVAGGIHCRAGGVKIGTFYNQPAKWDLGYSTVPVQELKNGATAKLACTSVSPALINDYNKPVKQGDIVVACNEGVLTVASANCVGDDDAAERAAAEAAAKKAADDAAAAAAAQAAADAAAQAASACQVSACGTCCNAATANWTYEVGSGKACSTRRVTYQNCDNGQKRVTASTHSSYSSGQCISSLPKGGGCNR